MAHKAETRSERDTTKEQLLLGKIELDAGVDIETRYDGSLTITRPEDMSTAKLLGKFDRAGFKVLSIDWESEKFRVIRNE